MREKSVLDFFVVLEELQRMAKENKGLVDLWCKTEVFHLDFCQKNPSYKGTYQQ